LTLNIDDKLAQKDFEVHKTGMQNRKPFFWVVQVVTTINLLSQSYRVFVLHEQIIGLVAAIIGTFHLQILWAITCCRFPKMSKYIFASYFVLELALNIYTAFNRDTESMLFLQTTYNENFVSTTVVYIIIMAFFTYCEFLLCLFLYSPIYLATCISLTYAQAHEITTVKE